MFNFSCIWVVVNFKGLSLVYLIQNAQARMPVLASSGLLYRRPDEVYNIFERSSGLEYSRDAQLLQFPGVLVRNYTANGDQDIVHALFPQQLHHSRNDRVVGARQDGQSDN